MTMTLTDPQYAVLSAAAQRGDNTILRGEDASESTLRSLAARNIGTLQTEMVGRRKVVTGLYVTVPGWLTWSAEADRRDAAARAEANARIPAPAQPDPFAVFYGAAARRAEAIDAAFAL